ncbi:hypothetical protein B4113_3952 [Geobacillus sp. B4113_201601]|nr:hypothetical protein B4113_3952 [Geobacillus sp. B4113_201601]
MDGKRIAAAFFSGRRRDDFVFLLIETMGSVTAVFRLESALA